MKKNQSIGFSSTGPIELKSSLRKNNISNNIPKISLANGDKDGIKRTNSANLPKREIENKEMINHEEIKIEINDNIGK